MPDQLSLRLDPLLPRLPASIRPMLARSSAQAFDSDRHLFEPRWGGERLLVFLEGGTGGPGTPLPRLVDRRGRDLALLLPELHDVRGRLKAWSAVLDGELVVADGQGRADRPGLRARLDGLPGPAVTFLAFDLLDLNGRPLLALALERRRELLAGVLGAAGNLLCVPAVRGDGVALFEAVVGQGLAGMMARRLQSPYLPGVRSSLWRYVAAPAAESGDAEDGKPANAEVDHASAPAQVDEPPAEDRWRAPVLALIRRLPLDDSE